MWRFPKSWGYPQSSSIWGVSPTKIIHFGNSHFQETPSPDYRLAGGPMLGRRLRPHPGLAVLVRARSWTRPGCPKLGLHIGILNDLIGMIMEIFMIYIYGCESKCKAPIHTLNPQTDPYPRSIPKRRWSRPIHTSGSPRADPYPNFDANPYICGRVSANDRYHHWLIFPRTQNLRVYRQPMLGYMLKSHIPYMDLIQISTLVLPQQN